MSPKFSANKKLGQHFLKDQKVIEKILATMPLKTTHILEIGPGPGAITEHLTKLEKNLLLLEMDKRFVEHWNNLGVKCLPQDAMQVDWQKLIKDQHLPFEYLWLVSNLPYNISAPLTVNLMSTPEISQMTLMYQKEVAEKILGTDGMCSLYALSHTYFEVQKICLVKPGAFSPPPKVDSLVLYYQRKNKPLVALEDFRKYEQFLRQLFAYPRKQLNSVLQKFMPTSELQNSQIHQIDLTIRAEKLSLDQVLTLYSIYSF
jgi:16S rRNA (adenine1518-N6/adenine1519-N6)-dimethyltransferase